MEQSELAGVLPPGTVGPSFELLAGPGEAFSSASLRGQPVVLLFYVADWNPVCTEQLLACDAVLDDFHRLGSRILAISVDGPWSHHAFAEARRVRFPLLSDFEPKGAVSRAYGAYDYKSGVAERALFMLDARGVVRWSYLAAADVNPGTAAVLAALDDLKGRSPPG